MDGIAAELDPGPGAVPDAELDPGPTPDPVVADAVDAVDAVAAEVRIARSAARRGPSRRRLLRAASEAAPGRPGRVADAWRTLCRRLVTREDVLREAEAVLTDRTHPAWLGCWRFMVEQGFGKSLERLDLTSAGEVVRQVLVIGDQRVEL